MPAYRRYVQAVHTDETTATSDRHRLPRTATPQRYDLLLAPDLVTATFTGEVAVTLTVHEATDELVCNAAELEITEAWVDDAGTTGAAQRRDGAVTLDASLEQAHIRFGSSLAPGEIVLHLRFSGVLTDKLRGFYRSTFTDESGATRSMAVTQFEATDARRAFPCWDEPEFKAIFGVTLRVADDLLAVSNGPELSRQRRDDGTVQITFADTMPMSTYLVAFVVGPLEATRTVDAGGVPLRVVCRPGQTPLAEFALEVGAFALRWLAEYYGIAYPGDKLDMVAVPDFAFGAMENLGCVTYRESLLLLDPATATQSEQVAVTDVIAHELAHMWFGDLVTMRWWNGIWLNEAFATFMEMKCSDAFRPAWGRWMQFGRERSSAFDVDALEATRPIEYPVHTPADAEGMFDTLTYQKGSAVVRMLEQYLGEDAFRDGIHRYLQTHQFGNTETTDLWDALEAETGEPVRAMMDSWIFQGGFPLVRAETVSGAVRASQHRFRYLPSASDDDTIWRVPLVARHGSETTRVALDVDTALLDLDQRPVVLNHRGHGFYRVAYDDDLRAQLVDGLADLEPLERYAFLDDALALTLRGDLHAAEVAGLVTRLADIGEENLAIWQLAAVVVDTLHRATPAGERAAFSAWVRATWSPLWARLGPECAPDDDDLRRALRGLTLGILGLHGDPAAQKLADALFEQYQADPASVDAELAAGALRSVAAHADAAQFDAMVERFRHGHTPQEQFRYLYAAAGVRDADLFGRYLDLLATDEVRSQNLAFAYRAALRNLQHGVTAWHAVSDRWDQIRERLPFNSTHRMIEGITTISDPQVADDIAHFLAGQDVPEARQLIAQHIERMQVQVALRTREADRLVDELP